jgi:hypothetical protein
MNKLLCVCGAILLAFAAANAGGGPQGFEETFKELDTLDRWTALYPVEGAGVKLNKQEIELQNGGGLLTQSTWTMPHTVEIQWTWSGNNDRPDEADVFQLLLRTDGTLKGKRLQVTVDAGKGELRVEAVEKGITKVLARKNVRVEQEKQKAGLPEGAGQNWYVLKVADNTDGTLRVWFGDDKEPTVAKYDVRASAAGKVGFRNAKRLENADRVSYVRRVKIVEKQWCGGE